MTVTPEEQAAIDALKARYDSLEAFFQNFEPPVPQGLTWPEIENWWGTASLFESNKYDPLDLTGWTLDFEDHFTSFTLEAENATSGNWFSPVRDDITSAAFAADPTDTDVYGQSGSDLTITMLEDGQGGWKSGCFLSVNNSGQGRTFTPPFYLEFRAKCSQSIAGADGAWPAFWLKAYEPDYNEPTQQRVEIDIYEGYSTDPKGHHQAYHQIPAINPQPGQITERRTVGNYTGLPNNGWPVGSDVLFDGEYHTYGLMIDTELSRWFFDGHELGRFPTQPDMLQAFHILVDLGLVPQEEAAAQGTYTMALDYVRAYVREAG